MIRSLSFRLMVLLTLCLVAVGTMATVALARPDGAQTSCSGAVSWKTASQYVGRVMTVRGRVAGARYASTSNGSPTFLNLGVDYPNSRRFTVVIWGRDRENFRMPEQTYRYRTICVRGLVRDYYGVAEIFAYSPSQIRIA